MKSVHGVTDKLSVVNIRNAAHNIFGTTKATSIEQLRGRADTEFIHVLAYINLLYVLYIYMGRLSDS